MGPVKEVPGIGETLHKWVFPSCLCLMTIITATGLNTRMMKCFGAKGTYISPNENATRDKILDGQFLVNKYRDSKFSDG